MLNILDNSSNEELAFILRVQVTGSQKNQRLCSKISLRIYREKMGKYRQ